MAPEFIKDCKNNQCSFKLDVYAFGIVLFMLINEFNPFVGLTRKEILENALNGKRPEFNENVNEIWKELIVKCWDLDPSKRPDFSEICDTIENKFVKCERFQKI